jgi:hypothetical protein
VALHIGAQVQEGCIDPPSRNQEENEQQPPKAAITVEKRMEMHLAEQAGRVEASASRRR